MKLIVITAPEFFEHESDCITALFHNGLEHLHLRKPNASTGDICHLLNQIPTNFHHRIVLHDHFELTQQYNFQGVHLNARNPLPPTHWEGHISKSCHSIDEVEQYKSQCDYLFLSPIFNSISKQGYTSHLKEYELEEAHSKGIIDNKVIALGGMTKEKLSKVEQWGFGGAAFLGTIWQPFGLIDKIDKPMTIHGDIEEIEIEKRIKKGIEEWQKLLNP